MVEVTIEANKKGKTKAEKKTRVQKPNKYIEERIKLLLRSSNVVFANDHIFKDPYFLCRDAICP